MNSIQLLPWLVAISFMPALVAKVPEMAVVFSSCDEAKYPAPTAERPTYFVAYSGGYIEEGPPWAEKNKDTEITKEEIFSGLYPALLTQHYRPADKDHPPSVVLLAQWGYMNVDIDDGRHITEYAQRRAALLVGANRIDKGDFNAEFVYQNYMRDDRYILVVSAFDYAAWQQKRRSACGARVRAFTAPQPPWPNRFLP